MTQEELNELQKKALAQFKTGKPLFGKDGAFAPMLKQFLESALEAEMSEHLDEQKREVGNKRNGKGKKTIKSSTGSFDIETAQDRQSSFDPQIVKKRETVLADNLQDKIIGLYGCIHPVKCILHNSIFAGNFVFKKDEKQLDWDRKAALRLKVAMPILRNLQQWLTVEQQNVLPQSAIGKAIAYSRGKLPR